jgi:hypothetical protein
MLAQGWPLPLSSHPRGSGADRLSFCRLLKDLRSLRQTFKARQDVPSVSVKLGDYLKTMSVSHNRRKVRYCFDARKFLCKVRATPRRPPLVRFICHTVAITPPPKDKSHHEVLAVM